MRFNVLYVSSYCNFVAFSIYPYCRFVRIVKNDNRTRTSSNNRSCVCTPYHRSTCTQFGTPRESSRYPVLPSHRPHFWPLTKCRQKRRLLIAEAEKYIQQKSPPKHHKLNCMLWLEIYECWKKSKARFLSVCVMETRFEQDQGAIVSGFNSRLNLNGMWVCDSRDWCNSARFYPLDARWEIWGS